MRYIENCGVVIGLISYSYDTKGHELYENTFKEGLFKGYKDDILRNSVIKKDEDDDEVITEFKRMMYVPRGYRMFGDHGLAVISLIDDFAFGNRVFHSEHGYNAREGMNNYNCQVITGICESEVERESYVRMGALNTFLREEDRFPFIGITKLKVRNELLIGLGTDLTYAVKKRVNDLAKNREKEDFACIIVDCFDNNELTMLLFSTDLVKIHEFSTMVRAMVVKDMPELACEKSLLFRKISNSVDDAHVFSSLHTSLGYDVEFNFEKDNSSFLPCINKDANVKLRWETKPGHIEAFKKDFNDLYLVKQSMEFPSDSIDNITMTGGNTISITLPLKDIHFIEEICLEPSIRIHTRKLRVRLTVDWIKDTNSYSDKYHENASSLEKDRYVFEEDVLLTLRHNLDKCRVSKILRERLLKLFGLYNNCVNDPLFTVYFLELRGALANILRMVNDFERDKNIPVKDIVKSISESISAFEEAYYNRLYQKNVKDTNLEYNGGVQQYITSLDWVYKSLLRVLTPKRISENYLDSFVFVSGYETVTSARSNLRLNINQLTYPELFVTSVWKEASNFTYPFQNMHVKVDSRDCSYVSYVKKYNNWIDFISRKRAITDLKDVLYNASFFDVNDETYLSVAKMLHSRTIQYLYIDQQTYHFGFNRDFELFYHFYWKYFLQTSHNYNRSGHINKNMFLSFLFRICIVAFADTKDTLGVKTNMSDDLEALRYTPFDPALSDLWFTDFYKVFKCAKEIWNELNSFYFEDICTCEIAALERNANHTFVNVSKKIQIVGEEDPYVFLELCKRARFKDIRAQKERIQNSKLSSYLAQEAESEKQGGEELHDANHVICLLNGYLHAIKELDSETDGTMISIPRREGEVHLNDNVVKKQLIGISADPQGGMFIGNMHARKKYFAYRSVLYRSLWDFTMKSKIHTTLFNSGNNNK